jgi:hypothetical protein
MTDHDIVHELLHVLWPDAEHGLIEEWTERLSADPELAHLLNREMILAPQTEQPSPLVKEFYP